MSSPLGFVVLARRPGQPDEIVSAVFPDYPNGLEQAQNVLESFAAKSARRERDQQVQNLESFADPVEYVIGEIAERTP